MSFTPGYYRPFADKDDDEEEDSGSDSDDSSSIGFNDNSVRGLDDPRYAIVRAAGPPLPTNQSQLFYQSFKKPMGYDYEVSGDSMSSLMAYYPSAAPSQTVQTTLFSFTSTNRDVSVYPLSTYFTLKTPRVYKNITQIQFVQINFPYFLNSITDISSTNLMVANYAVTQTGFDFSNCYTCLGNTSSNMRSMVGSLRGGSFSEQGRTNPTAPTKPLLHTFQLPTGQYDKFEIANEMNRQLNTTPPFNLISYAAHRQLFQTSQQVGHLFNDPGLYYYSPSTKTLLTTATKAQVQQDYLPNAFTATGVPTEREIFVAYFFPVLRAALYTDYDAKFLDLGGTSIDLLQQRALQAFEGLGSDYYYTVLYQNVSLLQQLRRVNTFEYCPINTYQWSYNPATKSISAVHTDLHPTIQKDIQLAHQQNFQQAVAKRGYTVQQYGALQTQQNEKVRVLNTWADQVNQALVEVGIPYNRYPMAYLANPQSIVTIQPKRFLGADQTAVSDASLFALTVPVTPHVTTARSFPASFGSLTLADLVQDASQVQIETRGFTPPYAQHLLALNRNGSFATLYQSFVQAWTAHDTIVQDIATVTSATQEATRSYVNAKYATVFPPSLLAGTAYLGKKGTGGVTFYNDRSIHYASSPADTDLRSISPITSDASCCIVMNADLTNFYSCLPSEYVYNTVFYQLFATTSPNNILNIYVTEGLTASPATNNIYLQLNEEQSLNTMDIGGKEDYTISNEGTGECKKVFGKLLTQGSSAGSVTQTIVQIPARFPVTSPLASLDHFTFNFLLDTMVPLSKLYPFVPNDSTTNWNAILQIDELVSAPATAPA
jgi:hypothetical protein